MPLRKPFSLLIIIQLTSLSLQADYEIEGDTAKGEAHFGPKISRLATKPLLKGFAFACVGASPDMTKSKSFSKFLM